MSVAARPHHDAFESDLKRIYGDRDGVVSDRPSRPQLEELKMLCTKLWGTIDKHGKRVIPELISEHKGDLRTAADTVYEVRYAPWGGQLLEMFPPKFVPKCRIWFIREDNGIERLIAMTTVASPTDDTFQDFEEVVMPRILEDYPYSRVER